MSDDEDPRPEGEPEPPTNAETPPGEPPPSAEPLSDEAPPLNEEPPPSADPAAPVDWAAPAGPAAVAAPVSWEVPEPAAGVARIDVGPLLGRVLDTYARRWPLFVALGVPTALYGVAIQLAFGPLASGGSSATITNLWPLTLIGLPISIFSALATILAADDIRADRPTSLASVAGRALRRTFTGTLNLAVEILAFAFAAILPVLVIGSAVNAGGAAAVIAGILVVVGLVLLVIVGLRWILASSAIALGGAGPIKALSRSWAVTDGHLWKLFGLLFIVGLLIVPLTIGASLLGLGDPIVAAAALVISGLLGGPLISIALSLAYGDLTDRPIVEPAARPAGGARTAIVGAVLGLGIVASVAGVALNGDKIGDLTNFGMASVPIADRGKIFFGTGQDRAAPCRPTGARTTFTSADRIYIGGYFSRVILPGDAVLVKFYIDDVETVSQELRATTQALGCYYELEPVEGLTPAVYKLTITKDAETIAEGSFTVE